MIGYVQNVAWVRSFLKRREPFGLIRERATWLFLWFGLLIELGKGTLRVLSRMRHTDAYRVLWSTQLNCWQ